MTPAEEKNLAFVLDWWREVIEARHAELAANYAAEDFIQHNPNVPTGRAALVTFFKSLGPAIEPIPDRLTNPLVEAVFPFISPDGTRVAFHTDKGEIFVISMEGGMPLRAPNSSGSRVYTDS